MTTVPANPSGQPVSGIAPDEYRQALGSFPSGVTIVTAMDGELPVGTTVSAFTALSIDPPLVLVCLACALHEIVPGGDHTILLGHAQSSVVNSALAPLTYFRGAFVDVVDRHAKA